MSRLHYLDAYHMAIDLVKKAGFVFHHASQKSESCYYYHPSRPDCLMRISAHKSGKSRIGFSDVVSKVSFPPKDLHCYEKSVRHKMTMAIGRYFLTDKPKSEYKGKRGTWENSGTLVDFYD